MQKISVHFYEIKFHEPRRTTELITLDRLPRVNGGFPTFIQQFFASLPVYNPVANATPPANGALVLKPIYIDQARLNIDGQNVSGLIRAGEGGYDSDILNGRTGQVDLEKTADHIEVLPFYFCVDAPADTNVAVIGFQTFGVHGVASPVKVWLKDFLTTRFPGLTVKILPIHVGDLIVDEYINAGIVSEIEATKYTTPRDAADGHATQIKQKISITPSKRGEHFTNALNLVLRRKRDDITITNDAVIQEIVALSIPTSHQIYW